MAVNPVLINDLRKSLFRRKPVLAVAIMAIIILVLTLGLSGLMPSYMFRDIPLWRFPDLLLPVVVPAFAAGAFAKEYEQRTWQDVLLTRLYVSEILGGKFFAVLLPTVATIIVLFPPFALLLIIQNLNWAMNPGPWMLVVLGKFLVSATFYIALVLVCSYYSSNARTALVVSYVSLCLYALLNYALWRFLLIPAFYPDSGYYFSRADYYLPDNRPWGTDRMQFSLTPIEILHLIQSALFGGILLWHLASRLRLTRSEHIVKTH
jgi:ABC-type transport system involved in multi-copper enzyme maturation permease subunit